MSVEVYCLGVIAILLTSCLYCLVCIKEKVCNEGTGNDESAGNLGEMIKGIGE
mgnify:CR=1 FL=1